MSSSIELRNLYNSLKEIEKQENDFRKQLKNITKTKDGIRNTIENYMKTTNVQLLEVTGTADSLELVEQKKYETINKDVVIRKIVEFYKGVGSTNLFQSLEPVKQAEAVIHAVYTERDLSLIHI